jgi:hypothetical protein
MSRYWGAVWAKDVEDGFSIQRNVGPGETVGSGLMAPAGVDFLSLESTLLNIYQDITEKQVCSSLKAMGNLPISYVWDHVFVKSS